MVMSGRERDKEAVRSVGNLQKVSSVPCIAFNTVYTMEVEGEHVRGKIEAGLLTLKPCMKTSSNVFLIAADIRSSWLENRRGGCLHGVSDCPYTSPR